MAKISKVKANQLVVVKHLKKLAEARMIRKVETLFASFARSNTSHTLRFTFIISRSIKTKNSGTSAPMLLGLEEDQGRSRFKISQVK